MNIVKAAANGLQSMESPEQVAARRGISVDKMFGRKEAK
jgi:small subunit ribosomal protein S5